MAIQIAPHDRAALEAEVYHVVEVDGRERIALARVEASRQCPPRTWWCRWRARPKRRARGWRSWAAPEAGLHRAEARLVAQVPGLRIVARIAPPMGFDPSGAHGAEVIAALGSSGAGLDFLSGEQRRAPLWVRRLAMEWLWRMLSHPHRLIPRYARCAAILPGLAVQAWRLRG